MALKIYNTLKRDKEVFSPINPPYVGMYVCGPTVYGHAHLGHARSYTFFDTVYRYLKYKKYNVRYIQNITDVGHLVGDVDEGEDKIGKQARLEKMEPMQIAYKYETSYFHDMDKLNILRPSLSCRATGHIIEMINHISILIEKGFAYVTDKNNVYFEVRKFKNYGNLSGRNLEDTKEGERINIADDKRNPEDFALWKSADQSHLMRWPSPWGDGYPGWHIECSVMSAKYIGETLDIHGGGMDNIFPHHECEIAQSEAVTGKPFVNYFIHNNMLTVNGTKMSKSMNNFIVLHDLFQNIDPMVLRFYILQSHYRSVLDFTQEAMKAAGVGFDRLTNSIFALKNAVNNKQSTSSIDDFNDIKELKNKFIEAMDDDFNTPIAISILFDIMKLSNKEISSSNCNYDKLNVIYTIAKELFENILGFNLETKNNNNATREDELIKLLINLRKQYRDEKNYKMSDNIRDSLDALGIILKDSSNGTDFTK